MDVSRLTLERWALGDLPPSEAAALEARLADDAELAAHAERVRVALDAAANDLPAAPEWGALGAAPADAPPRGVVIPGPWGRARTPLIVGAVAALVFVFVGLRPDPAPTTTFRGALDVQVQLIRGGAASEQGLLVQARAGDRLQYTVTPPAAGWVSVFDLQDDGQLATWTPPREVYAQQPVQGAVLLDDYAGSERVFFVFAEQPIDEAAAKATLEQAFDTPLVSLESLPGLEATQRSVLLLK
jgi:anti-sigma factor RsiW